MLQAAILSRLTFITEGVGAKEASETERDSERVKMGRLLNGPIHCAPGLRESPDSTQATLHKGHPRQGGGGLAQKQT